MSWPLAYLITWRCYGTWLHGEPGAVDRRRNVHDTPTIPRNQIFADWNRDEMKQPQMILTGEQRRVIAESIERTCEAKQWTMLALNVRTNHVHVVVAAELEPERIMTTLKAWGTRSLRENAIVASDARLWARHGSTIHLRREDEVSRARWYVTDMQDKPV